jgi:hypothetical protein
MSQIVTISLPDALYETLTNTARQTGQPLETVAARWLAAAARHFAHDPLDSFIGAFDSGGIDWADNHDHYFGQPLAEDGADVRHNEEQPRRSRLLVANQ